jgi:hypothetical protein
LVATVEQKKACIEERASARDYLPWRYELFSWPEGITTWAIIATGFAIFWQAMETRRAAVATKKAAEAALLNAQAVINAERGRLLFEIEKKLDERHRGTGIFTIFATNYGRTPAEILGYAPPTETVVESTDKLPVPPQYEPEIAPIKRFLAPSERCAVAQVAPGSFKHTMAAMKVATESGVSVNDQSRIAFGEIRYTDGISDQARHSRYCLRLERFPFSNIGGSLVPSGPPEYNECT